MIWSWNFINLTGQTKLFGGPQCLCSMKPNNLYAALCICHNCMQNTMLFSCLFYSYEHFFVCWIKYVSSPFRILHVIWCKSNIKERQNNCAHPLLSYKITTLMSEQQFNNVGATFVCREATTMSPNSAFAHGQIDFFADSWHIRLYPKCKILCVDIIVWKHFVFLTLFLCFVSITIHIQGWKYRGDPGAGLWKSGVVRTSVTGQM